MLGWTLLAALSGIGTDPEALPKDDPTQQKPALSSSISQTKKKDIPLTRQEEKKHGMLGTGVSPLWLLLCTSTTICLSPLAVMFGYPLDGEKEEAKAQRHRLEDIQAPYINCLSSASNTARNKHSLALYSIMNLVFKLIPVTSLPSK